MLGEMCYRSRCLVALGTDGKLGRKWTKGYFWWRVGRRWLVIFVDTFIRAILPALFRCRCFPSISRNDERRRVNFWSLVGEMGKSK